MDLTTVIYIISFSVMALTLIIMVLIVAGRDIYLAFKRWFSKRGCEVYLANQTRTISHYFMIPKDGVFRIRKLPYVTNPEKTMNLTEEEKGKVIDSITKRTERLKGRIKETEGQIKHLRGLLELSDKEPTRFSEKQVFFMKSRIEHYESMKKELKDKLRLKQENYFKNKRPAFFYIENDPIPKDFYEYYSALDSKMVDNLVSRSLSQPPSVKTDKEMKLLKLLCWGAALAAVFAGYMAMQNNQMVIEICHKVGAACKGGLI